MRNRWSSLITAADLGFGLEQGDRSPAARWTGAMKSAAFPQYFCVDGAGSGAATWHNHRPTRDAQPAIGRYLDAGDSDDPVMFNSLAQIQTASSRCRRRYVAMRRLLATLRRRQYDALRVQAQGIGGRS
jgi:hypothetical protein